MNRTSAKIKAREVSKYFRKERPDYNYLKDVFRYLREELEIEIPRESKKLPYVPSEEDIQKYYEAVWNAQDHQDMVIIKTILYTGIRVSELVNIKITVHNNIPFNSCSLIAQNHLYNQLFLAIFAILT